MQTTQLSSKGQVIIPKAIRDSHHWSPGLELEVTETEDGLLLTPKASFSASDLEEVAGCLDYKGQAKTPQQIEAAMQAAAKEAWRGRR